MAFTCTKLSFSHSAFPAKIAYDIVESVADTLTEYGWSIGYGSTSKLTDSGSIITDTVATHPYVIGTVGSSPSVYTDATYYLGMEHESGSHIIISYSLKSFSLTNVNVTDKPLGLAIIYTAPCEDYSYADACSGTQELTMKPVCYCAGNSSVKSFALEADGNRQDILFILTHEDTIGVLQRAEYLNQDSDWHADCLAGFFAGKIFGNCKMSDNKYGAFELQYNEARNETGVPNVKNAFNSSIGTLSAAVNQRNVPNVQFFDEEGNLVYTTAETTVIYSLNSDLYRIPDTDCRYVALDVGYYNRQTSHGYKGQLNPDLFRFTGKKFRLGTVFGTVNKYISLSGSLVISWSVENEVSLVGKSDTIGSVGAPNYMVSLPKIEDELWLPKIITPERSGYMGDEEVPRTHTPKDLSDMSHCAMRTDSANVTIYSNLPGYVIMEADN